MSTTNQSNLKTFEQPTISITEFIHDVITTSGNATTSSTVNNPTTTESGIDLPIDKF